VADQIKHVTPYAEAHGYNILRWYADDGISGDDTKNRAAFKRMVADAQSRGDFVAIVCWNQKRFGRFDPTEAGYWVFQLREAGVYLVTTDKGRVDWDTLHGQLIAFVDQMASHDFLLTQSRDICRGLIEVANNGGWMGCTPYAYRTEGPKKHRRLVVGDPSKVRIVKRIYREYVQEQRSLRDIARRLNRDGMPTPGGDRVRGRGKAWGHGRVAEILSNPAYVGDRIRDRATCGKYSTMRAGAVVKSDGRHKRPRAEWVVEKDRHEAIIDRATWDAAQRLLQNGGRARPRPQAGQEPGYFAGRLLCGKCGQLLYAVHNRRRPERGRHYECSTTRQHGAAGCPGTTVKEGVLLISLAEHLEKWIGLSDSVKADAPSFREWLTADDPLPAVYQEVRDLIAPPPPSTPKQDRKATEQHVATLKAKVERARANLVHIENPANIPAAEREVGKMVEQLRLYEEELERTKQPTAAEVNRLVEGVLESLFGLALCCRALARHRATRPAPDADPDADFPADAMEEDSRWYWDVAAPDAVRQLLSRIGHVVIHTTITGTGTHTRHQFERGEIVFQPVPAGSPNGRKSTDLPPGAIAPRPGPPERQRGHS
jgi:DNA invertase Pin-like site-specific DNA recombinase